MVNWSLRAADDEVVNRMARELALPPVVARLLWLRGYTDSAIAGRFLATRDSLAYLSDPLISDGMAKAVARIRRAVADGEAIAIYGDYDCDGVTSATILYRYLKRGLKANVIAYLPDRFKDGYGVTPAAVERLAAQGITVILTCDNGISAHAAAATAIACGVDLVVTDHHQVPAELPNVHAIVHPQVDFPHLRDLCGAGVAYLFVVAMEGSFSPRMETFLDFSTMGTVGDVVPLDGPNRPLVWAGLSRFRAGQVRHPGVLALGEVAKASFAELTAQDVAFKLVPRLNAAGRLETPDIGFRLLATNDFSEANALASQLNTINSQRRDLSSELEATILARVEREWDLAAEPFIVLADTSFHHGVTGIIAGKLKDRFRVPVLLFSGHDESTPWKASGRSPEGVHLYEAMHACREHLLSFGGHAQAAGGSATFAQLAPLRAALNAHLRDTGWQRPEDTVWLDAELPFSQATDELLDALDRLEPFGQRNPAPVFGLLRAKVVSQRVIKNHLFLTLDDSANSAAGDPGQSGIKEVICWGMASRATELSGWVRLTFAPKRDEFRGVRRVSLTVDRIEVTTPPPPVDLGDRRFSEDLSLDDRRGQAWGGVTTDEQVVTLYGAEGDGNGCRVLWPGDVLGGPLGHLVLCELPPDQSTWQALLARAERATLAWPLDEPVEPDLTPDWLRAFFHRLERQPDLSLQAIVRAAKRDERAAALAAIRLFREAGIMVVRGSFWSLLAPPPADIDLLSLAAYRAYHDNQAFRRHLRKATLAQARVA